MRMHTQALLHKEQYLPPSSIGSSTGCQPLREHGSRRKPWGARTRHPEAAFASRFPVPPAGLSPLSQILTFLSLEATSNRPQHQPRNGEGGGRDSVKFQEERNNGVLTAPEGRLPMRMQEPFSLCFTGSTEKTL